MGLHFLKLERHNDLVCDFVSNVVKTNESEEVKEKVDKAEYHCLYIHFTLPPLYVAEHYRFFRQIYV